MNLGRFIIHLKVFCLKNKQNKRLDFIPNKQNKYSIRKFTVGTASILVGVALILAVQMMKQK